MDLPDFTQKDRKPLKKHIMWVTFISRIRHLANYLSSTELEIYGYTLRGIVMLFSLEYGELFKGSNSPLSNLFPLRIEAFLEYLTPFIKGSNTKSQQ